MGGKDDLGCVVERRDLEKGFIIVLGYLVIGCIISNNRMCHSLCLKVVYGGCLLTPLYGM